MEREVEDMTVEDWVAMGAKAEANAGIVEITMASFILLFV
jgi:hypothetical protein